jgi:hypothetical protein
MTPSRYALARPVYGTPTGPDFRVALDPGDQTDADELARIERYGGRFQEDGRDWLCEIYQELLDAYGYAVAYLGATTGGGVRESNHAWAMVHNLHDRCDALRRRMERRDGDAHQSE